MFLNLFCYECWLGHVLECYWEDYKEVKKVVPFILDMNVSKKIVRNDEDVVSFPG